MSKSISVYLSGTGKVEHFTIPGPFRDIDAIKRANAQADHHFFERGALRFFDSRIGRAVYGGRFFITSEQFHSSPSFTGLRFSNPRRYTVRVANDDGTIETVTTFNALESCAQARAAIRRILKDQCH